MSITSVAWALRLKVGSPTLKTVLIAVANYADENGKCWPSTKRLAEDTELTKRSILTALKGLEEKGLIRRTERRREDGSRASDIIELIENNGGEKAALGGEGVSPRGERAAPGVVNVVQGGGEGVSPLTTFEPSLNHQSEPSKEERADALAFPPKAFALFWDLYPNKVGKQAAEKSFEAVRKRRVVAFEALMTGLRIYLAKTDDRPWCNPTTWLNQGRWDDVPANVVAHPRQSSHGPPRRKPPSNEELWADIAFEADENLRRKQHGTDPFGEEVILPFRTING